MAVGSLSVGRRTVSCECRNKLHFESAHPASSRTTPRPGTAKMARMRYLFPEWTDDRGSLPAKDLEHFILNGHHRFFGQARIEHPIAISCAHTAQNQHFLFAVGLDRFKS